DPHLRVGRLHELAPLALDTGSDRRLHAELHALPRGRRSEEVIIITLAAGSGERDEGHEARRKRLGEHANGFPLARSSFTPAVGRYEAMPPMPRNRARQKSFR